MRKNQIRESELLTYPVGSRNTLWRDATPFRRLAQKGAFSPGKPADLKIRGPGAAQANRA